MKPETTDVVLGVLSVLGVGALAAGTVYSAVREDEALRRERYRLRLRLLELEDRRVVTLTTREVREMERLRGRLKRIDEALY